MTIKVTQGDLLKDDAEAIVNTVNCAGVMGKGIALQFKNKWPSNFRAYEAACKAKAVRPGKMFVHGCGGLVKPHYIINFPTKDHWRGKSDIGFIKDGLIDLVQKIRDLGIRSVAVPPLGCGNGGLEWTEVRPLIEAAFMPLGDVEVRLFEPSGGPPAKSMDVHTERPRMTAGRAAILKVVETYRELRYGLSKIEVQKLAYFLQEAGEPLNLRFVKHLYGPYSEPLRHALNKMEGHFIRGLGDGVVEAEIEPMEDALREADDFVQSHVELGIAGRVERVARLIEGFQSSYGMELLASVHWVATHEGGVRSKEDAISAVHAWNPRKKALITGRHVTAAWKRLEDHGWLTRTSIPSADGTPPP